LRNDPDIINDVGLIVLDEGHLIGPSEREIRYEIWCNGCCGALTMATDGSFVFRQFCRQAISSTI
jgi:hypothetical protein